MAGGDLYVLKAILGHKSIAMTQRYAHLSPAYKKAMVERMEQMWAQPVQRPVEANPKARSRPPVRRSIRAVVAQPRKRLQNLLRIEVSPSSR